MNNSKINRKAIAYAFLLLVAGILLGRFVFTGSGTSKTAAEHTDHEQHDEEQQTIWTCSMHPQIREDQPGQCPICGMDLIPLDGGASGAKIIDADALQMTEAAIKLADIQTAEVLKQEPEKEIYLLGRVKPDERLIYSQTAHIPGRIEKLYINFTGEKVHKGQRLASIYSPDLITAQKELFEILRDTVANPYLLDASRNKLRLWKFSDEQIKRLENEGELQTEIDILSDYDGYVYKRNVALGDHIMEGEPLFHIMDLSHVWVMLEAYESDLPWIKLGDKVEIGLDAIPGSDLSGKISYIDPFINPDTRVANVRVEMPNRSDQLKPDMFANGRISSKLKLSGPALLIPKSAVLWTGKRAVVYVKLPELEHPTFKYREISLGEDAGDFYVVKKGLEEGEEIAVNGVFRIDAAAQLAGKPSMMNPEGGKVNSGHNHGGGQAQEADSQQQESAAINQDEVSAKFKKQLGEVVSHYLVLKNALVETDVVSAEKASAGVASSLDKVEMKLLKGDQHKVWMHAEKLMIQSLADMKNKSDVEQIRAQFEILSTALSDAVLQLGVNTEGQTLYIDFCPMANEAKGAFWISEKEKIENPYFGDDMPGCGEVRSEVN